MADTSIEWTSKVWNPVRGCSRVSKGCDNCYAMRMAHRHSGPGRPYEGLTTIRKGKVDWMGSARFVPEQLAAPFGWKKSRMIFVNSMSDLFHESLDFEHIAACFGVMAAANWHTYQVLTKRIDRVPEFFRWLDGWNFEDGSVRVERLVGAAIAAGLPEELVPSLNATWPLPNVWLGVSVENQKAADERIPLLLRCPAAIRWISAEPLIGPLELEDYLSGDCAPVDYGGAFYEESGPALDWVVVGGESGNGSRPFDLSWARNIVHDCEEAGVACFVKQLGKRPFDTGHDSVGHDSEISHDADVSTKTLEDLLKEYPVKLKSRKGADPGEWEAYLRVRQFPEARAM